MHEPVALYTWNRVSITSDTVPKAILKSSVYEWKLYFFLVDTDSELVEDDMNKENRWKRYVI